MRQLEWQPPYSFISVNCWQMIEVCHSCPDASEFHEIEAVDQMHAFGKIVQGVKVLWHSYHSVDAHLTWLPTQKAISPSGPQDLPVCSCTPEGLLVLALSPPACQQDLIGLMVANPRIGFPSLEGQALKISNLAADLTQIFWAWFRKAINCAWYTSDGWLLRALC